MNTGMHSMTESEAQNADVRRGRWTGLLLMAVIAVPMLAAYLIYSTGLGVPADTVNKGDLLLPATSLQGLAVTGLDGQPLTLVAAVADKKWRWLIVANNTCDQACRENLYLSRQVHIRLGDKAERLQRVFLNTDNRYSPELLSWLQAEHPRLVLAHVQADDWRRRLQQTSAANSPVDGSQLFVVDQQGYAMMTYHPGHQGADLLDDIKRLLKYSYED